jgi:opacity protein-like surface antigen
MKKLLFIAMITLAGIGTVTAQSTKFFSTAGFTSATAKGKAPGIPDVSETESGIYGGVGAIFGLDDKSGIFTELSYSNIDDTNFIQLPVLYKYEFVDKFSLLAGPEFVYLAEESIDDFSNFSVGLAAGLSYDISEDFFVLARYMFQMTNSYTGPVDDVSLRTSFLNIGVGYSF